MKNITAYPLCWPEGHTRIHGDRYWPKAPTPGAARDQLFHELETLGATVIILSTNVPATKAGTFYASYREPKDSGAAVYFKYRGRNRVLACDAYCKLNMNIRAIAITVEQLRRIEKRGVADFLDKVFTGFDALPAGNQDSREWWEVLGVLPSASYTQARAAYRALIKACHPDGPAPDRSRFDAVQEAWKSLPENMKY